MVGPYVWKRLWRRPWICLCSLAMSAVLCVLLSYLSNYRENQQQKLEEARDAFEVRCIVTDIKGTKSTGLRLREDVLQFVTDETSPLSPYIKDIRITKEFTYSAPEYGVQTILDGDYTPLIGITDAHCADQLDPDQGKICTYFTEDFYRREDYVCLVSEGFYQQLESDSITLSITDPIINPIMQPELGKGTVEFQVVGFYPGNWQIIYIPFEAAKKLEKELSGRISCDSISFLAADNRWLSALTEAAAERFGRVDPMFASNDTSALALTVQDAQYQATVAALEQNIQRVTLLLPVILLLSLGAGFFASILSTRNQGRNYALMRTVGLTRKRLFLSVLSEQLLLPAVAGGITAAVSGEGVLILIYLLCYTAGCIACIIKTVTVPPTAILREQE